MSARGSRWQILAQLRWTWGVLGSNRGSSVAGRGVARCCGREGESVLGDSPGFRGYRTLNPKPAMEYRTLKIAWGCKWDTAYSDVRYPSGEGPVPDELSLDRLSTAPRGPQSSFDFQVVEGLEPRPSPYKEPRRTPRVGMSLGLNLGHPTTELGIHIHSLKGYSRGAAV